MKENRSQPARLRFSYAVPYRDGRLGHLCHKQQVYGKVKHPQGNHLHQRQRGGGLRQADSFRDEQARERAEPHGHRLGRVHFPRQENQGTEAVPQGARAEHRLRRLRMDGNVQQGTSVRHGNIQLGIIVHLSIPH